MLVLALAGVGRGLATASDMTMPGFGIPGVAVQICHTAPGPTPADAPHHDCCDDCALAAGVALVEAPCVTGAAPVGGFVAHVGAPAWVPALGRRRTPRQPQGPPTA